MKIVILSDGFPPVSLGGAEVIAFNLAQAFGDKGHEVSVITTTKIKEEVGKLIQGGVTIYKIYSDYSDRWRAYISLYNLKVLGQVEVMLREIKPDITHAHNIHTNLSYASLKIAKKYSKALFLTLHDAMAVHYGKVGACLDNLGQVVIDEITPLSQMRRYKFRYNPFRNFIIRHYFKNVDKIFSVSQALKNVLESHGISNIEILNNGIRVEDWNINENKLTDFKNKHGLQDKKVMFFGGRLSAVKGGLVALEVLEGISKKINNAILLVVGNKNGWAEMMHKKAEEMGIGEKIVFTGWIAHQDMPYTYASSDIVLVLSQYIDPFPTINLEAMASKRPVIGTVFGGTSEIVLDNKTGYIVNPRETSSVIKKILDLLENPEKAKTFGLSGYDRVKSSFNENDWVEATLASYVTMLLKKK